MALVIINLFPVQFTHPVFAENIPIDKALRSNIKLSNKISKNFCNSLGFGISKESAIKFSIGEVQKEISKKNIFSKSDIDDLQDQIANKIIDKCGSPLGLYGQEGIADFKGFLLTNDLFAEN